VNAAGDLITSFTGDETLTFSGLVTANNGTPPTVTDNDGRPVPLGISETVHFINGVSSPASGAAMVTAYAAQSATLNVTDSGGLSSTSAGGAGASLTISSAAASQLVYLNSPVTTTAGVASASITVQRQDAFGNPVTTGTIGVALSSSSTGVETFSPASLVSIPDGSASTVFTYTDTQAGTPTLAAASAGLAGATQMETVVPAAASATQSAISATPASITADGASAATITVTLTDAYGNPLAGRTVTLAQSSGLGTPAITTTQGTTDSSGHATFTVKSTTAAADGFTATDTSDASLAITQTATVTFTPGTATHLVFVQQPSDTIAGTAINPAVTVYVEDANNNVVTGDNRSVTIGGTTFAAAH